MWSLCSVPAIAWQSRAKRDIAVRGLVCYCRPRLKQYIDDIEEQTKSVPEAERSSREVKSDDDATVMRRGGDALQGGV